MYSFFLKSYLFLATVTSVSVISARSMPTLSKQTATMLGTWEWHSGSETLRVVLQREPSFKLPDGSVQDVIVGTHSYSNKLQNMENSIGARGVNGNPGFTLFGFSGTGDRLAMSFHDLTKNKQGKVVLQMVPGQPNKMRWQLSPASETISINKVTPEGYTVPTTMLLTRVR